MYLCRKKIEKGMKKSMLHILPLWLLAATLLGISSCGMFSHESVVVETVLDSTSYSEPGKPSVTAVFDVDYPESGDPLMVRSVKQWMGSLLNLTDTTAMAGAERFAEAFFKQNETGREMLKNHPKGYEYRLTVRKVDETAAYVTFVITTLHIDGKNEQSARYGATFVKPTGKIFGYDMFDNQHPRTMAVWVMQGLQSFYNVDSFEELTALIGAKHFSSMDQGVNRMPEAAPWIEDNEVVFQYAQDELLTHDNTLPQARVSLSKARELFSADFQRALDEASK